MSNPNNLHSSNEDINNSHTYVQSKARVFFVRHGDTWVRDSIPQSNWAILKYVGKRQMQAVWKYLKIAGVRGTNNSIEFWEDTTRVVESVNIIMEQLIQGDEIKKSPTDMLRTTKKWQEDEERLMENGEVFIATVKLMKQIRERVNGSLEDNTEFILVWHKSNKSWPIQSADNINDAIEISFDIKNGGIIERDIDADTGKYINPKKHPGTLFLNRSNYKIILKILENIPELKSTIQIFHNNTKPESERYPIWKLQNQVNEFFSKNPTLFFQCLAQISPTSLRTFCLANLTRLKDYSTIEKYYLSESTTISPEEKELFLQNIQDSNIKSILRKLFVRKEKLWADTDSKLFDTEFYSLLKNSRAAYNTAKLLQWNSLDPLINKWEDGAILDRKLYFEEKEKSEQNANFNKNSSQEEEIIVRRNFDPNMFRKEKYSRFIIRGHVGEGKSMYLSELVKKFSLEEDVEIRFVRAKDFDDKLDILDGLFNNPNTLVCIDALDEAKAETREKIKSLFNGFTGRSIITTRHSEFFGPDEKAYILYFNPIDTDIYIDSRFPKDRVKATGLREWIKSQGLANEIQGNPLLLNLITLLASATEDEKKWMTDYQILPFDQIKTKADLYESVVRFVLAKHQLDQKGGTWSETMLDVYMERLGKYAFDIFSGAENIKVDQKFFDANLSVLFRSTENGTYDFIHKSFYEFFLAKHLANMPNGEGSREIYSFRDRKKSDTRSDWGGFWQIVLFYGEILVNNGNWDELTMFLWKEGLTKWDDMSDECFFIGLEMLFNLPQEKILNGLINNISEKYNNALLMQIDFWQNAVSEEYKRINPKRKKYKESEFVNKWYQQELKSWSYNVPNWKIPSERTLLFRQFRSSQYYYIRNIVSLVMRSLIEEMLRSDGIDATVFLASDSDDVFSGVNLIIEVETSERKEYVGIDIIISSGNERKEERTETICWEFNAYKRHGNKTMPRQFFIFPSYTMFKFLYNYMSRITSGENVQSEKLLILFEESKAKIKTMIWGVDNLMVHDIIH